MIYIMGTGTENLIKYFKGRETNFRRAKRTLKGLLAGNVKATYGEIATVKYDEDGIEYDMKVIYKTKLKKYIKEVWESRKYT